MREPSDAAGPPAFAVVGRVNKGKSSVVSTLAEDESVRIGREARTTRHVTAFRWEVDGEAYYEVLDTPGFERAEAALAWMRGRAKDATERLPAVRSFIAAHHKTGEFEMELRLLAPVMDGAAVVYVADATHPWRAHNEAELEILKWTGRPLIGLLNRTDAGRYESEWRAHLRDFCHMVRVFDAHQAGFEERLGLLRALRELSPEAAAGIDLAIDALARDWRRREEEAVAEIAGLVISSVTYCREEPLNDQGELEARREEIESAFHDALRRLEAKSHRRLAHLYRHDELKLEMEGLSAPVLGADLFTSRVWRNLGLTPGQLAAAGAIGGAALGVVGDVAAGGLTFGVFTIGGAILGGAGGLAAALGRVTSTAEIVGRLRGGGLRVRVGPHRNPQFGSVLVDRALLLLLALQGRPHARRDILRVEGASKAPEETAGVVRSLTGPKQRRLAQSLADIHRAARRSRRITAAQRASLEDSIADTLRSLGGAGLPDRPDLGG